jgi:tetratricopeptide (TPR) repeat protein
LVRPLSDGLPAELRVAVLDPMRYRNPDLISRSLATFSLLLLGACLAPPKPATEGTVSTSIHGLDAAQEAARAGRWMAAAEWAEKGLALANDEKRESDTSTLRLLEILARARAALNDNPAAEAAWERAVRWRERHAADDDAGLLGDRIALARAEIRRCKTDPAKRLLAASIATAEAAPVKHKVPYADALAATGQLYRSIGEEKDAEPYLSRAVELMMQQGSGRRYALLNALLDLAGSYRAMQQTQNERKTIDQFFSTAEPGPADAWLVMQAIEPLERLSERDTIVRISERFGVATWRSEPGLDNTLEKLRSPSAACSTSEHSNYGDPKPTNPTPTTRKHIDAFADCHSAALKLNHDTAGAALILSALKSDGTVRGVIAHGVGLPPSMLECAGRVALTITYAAPQANDVKVVTPLNFRGFR